MKTLSRKVLAATVCGLFVLLGCYAVLSNDLDYWSDASEHVMRDNQRAMLDGQFQAALTRAVGQFASFAVTGQRRNREESDRALQQAQVALALLKQMAQVAPPDRGSAKDEVFLERQIALLRMVQDGLGQASSTLMSAGQEAGSAAAAKTLELINAHQGEADALWTEIARHHETERKLNEAVLREHSEGAQGLIVAGVLAISLALGLLTFYVRLRIVRPLTALTDLTRRVAAGDLSTRAAVSRGDEIGQLQSSFNTMVDKLAKQRGDVAALLDGLAHARDTAQAASQAKTRFLANLSHEIRTPLHGVLVSLDLMHESSTDPEQGELTDIARVSARGLLRTLNDLLDVSRLEAGGVLPLEEVTFDVRRLVARSVDLCSRRAAEKGLEVRCKVADDVPVNVCGDPLRLAQVLVNLIDNAVKFTQRGSVRVAVSLSRQGEGAAAAPPGLPSTSVGLKFRVEDTGVGVSPAIQHKLFEPFYQADSVDSHGLGGIGLGLPIARQLATRMGGGLDFESTPGKGSSFWFTVRLKLDALCETSEQQVPWQVSQPRQFAEGGAVLLVDDHRDIREVMARTLRRRGLEVVTAENGSQAVELARARTFDLILMDCRMPVMDGFEATLAIRAFEGERAQVPIVALTAYGLTEPRQRYLDAGFDDLVVKPYKLAELESALHRWLVVKRRASAAEPETGHTHSEFGADAHVPASRH